MAERKLQWQSVEDFALEQLEFRQLVEEALRQSLLESNPQRVTTLGMTPRYRVEDANGNEISFPMTLKVEI